MKRFVFRLQALLRLRRLHEQDARLELERVQGALARSRARLEMIREERRVWGGRYNAAQQGEAAAAERLLIERYFAALDRQENLQLQEIARHEENVRIAAQAYQQKRREREQVERLQEKALAEHQLAAQHEELRDLDALNTMRFIRARRETLERAGGVL